MGALFIIPFVGLCFSLMCFLLSISASDSDKKFKELEKHMDIEIQKTNQRIDMLYANFIIPEKPKS